MRRADRVREGMGILRKAYPDATISLRFRSTFELVCAVALSAQATDASVNLVTPELFRRWPTPRAMADAPLAEVQRVIQSIGLYRGKARRLKAMGRMLVERFGGEVPGTMEELMELPGVARKTANVVLWNGFGRNEGIAVDTHAKRVAKRLGWTRHEAPEKVERDLVKVLPRSDWGDVTHLLIAHGRAVCTARRPACEACPLLSLCPTGPRILRERSRAR
ncbi:MAG: endonuclease III [Halobacteriales archaeon]|nr:endonuclease III [Halobacteriales archaeon]